MVFGGCLPYFWEQVLAVAYVAGLPSHRNSIDYAVVAADAVAVGRKDILVVEPDGVSFEFFR